MVDYENISLVWSVILLFWLLNVNDSVCCSTMKNAESTSNALSLDSTKTYELMSLILHTGRDWWHFISDPLYIYWDIQCAFVWYFSGGWQLHFPSQCYILSTIVKSHPLIDTWKLHSSRNKHRIELNLNHDMEKEPVWPVSV